MTRKRATVMITLIALVLIALWLWDIYPPHKVGTTDPEHCNQDTCKEMTVKTGMKGKRKIPAKIQARELAELGYMNPTAASVPGLIDNYSYSAPYYPVRIIEGTGVNGLEEMGGHGITDTPVPSKYNCDCVCAGATGTDGAAGSPGMIGIGEFIPVPVGVGGVVTVPEMPEVWYVGLVLLTLVGGAVYGRRRVYKG